MSRIALTSRDMAVNLARRQYVPVLTTLAATLLVLLPIVSTAPLTPSPGYLVALSWRLLRPELWTAKAGLSLGLFDDLVAGHPIGESMALWALTFLILDLIDSRAFFRDFWMDWLLASVLLVGHVYASWAISRMMGSEAGALVVLPQAAIAVFAYPLVARIVVALDRWRLAR